MAHDINWEHLNFKKFLIFNSVGFFFVRLTVYPPTVIKTRLQVQKENFYSSSFDAFRKIVKKEGYKGLYRGFFTMLAGSFPAQTVYISIIEFTRGNLKQFGLSPSDPLANLIAGGMGSIFSSLISVPSDVVSQRLMVQGMNGGQKERAIDTLRQIISKDGFRGLYRGYWLTMLTFGPSSAIWWAVYSATRTELLQWLHNEDVDKPEFLSNPKLPSLQAMVALMGCGMVAGLTSSLLSNPLDVVKTRYQVLTAGSTAETRSVVGMVRLAWQAEGPAAFLRGVKPRMWNSVIMSSIAVLTYEQTKLWSRISVS